ncbi:MAG: hypothetical protein L6R42_007072, partial [Xanthoria sp. 1 TBL-2021]
LSEPLRPDPGDLPFRPALAKTRRFPTRRTASPFPTSTPHHQTPCLKCAPRLSPSHQGHPFPPLGNPGSSMHLMYTVDATGKRLYTLKKVSAGEVTKSAHPARFSPDDKYSRYVMPPHSSALLACYRGQLDLRHGSEMAVAYGGPEWLIVWK